MTVVDGCILATPVAADRAALLEHPGRNKEELASRRRRTAAEAASAALD